MGLARRLFVTCADACWTYVRRALQKNNTASCKKDKFLQLPFLLICMQQMMRLLRQRCTQIIFIQIQHCRIFVGEP